MRQHQTGSAPETILISCTGAKMNIAKQNCICYNADRLRDTTGPQLARQEMNKLFPL